MKVQIRKRFRDADTRELMLPGRTTDYPSERAMKLARSGYALLLEAFPTVERELPDDFGKEEQESDETEKREENSSKEMRSSLISRRQNEGSLVQNQRNNVQQQVIG